jgi:hypothetical protein
VEDGALLWGIKVVRVPGGRRVQRLGIIVSTNQQLQSTFMPRGQRAILSGSPYSACTLGIMVPGSGLLGDVHTLALTRAINRLNRLVYPTQARQPFKLPEEPRHDLWKKQRNTKPEMWFSILQRDHRF